MPVGSLILCIYRQRKGFYGPKIKLFLFPQMFFSLDRLGFVDLINAPNSTYEGCDQHWSNLVQSLEKKDERSGASRNHEIQNQDSIVPVPKFEDTGLRRQCDGCCDQQRIRQEESY